MLVVLVGMLFLPEAVYFDAPLVPPLGKHEVATICALVGLLVSSPRQLRQARLGYGGDLFLLLMIPSIALTVLNNRDSIPIGPLTLAGLHMRDLLAIIVRTAVQVAVPYLAGRLIVGSSRDARALVHTFVSLGLVYSVLMVLEMRFSPQLHRWVYGYHARAAFVQTMRWGGYRPTVFLEHGLAVALFALAAVLLSATEGRVTKWRLGLPAGWSTLYLVVVLIFCRSTGAICLCLITLPVVLRGRPRSQLRVAILLATICVVYPGLKLAGLFPDQAIEEFTGHHLGAQRAESITVRFDSEKRLIDHTRERLWFGWGGFGRNRLYNESGQSTIIIDGYWIIQLSSGGLLLLVCCFGLMLYPVMRAARVLRWTWNPRDRFVLAGLAVALACYVFDLLPNGMFSPAPLFLAGALARLNLELSRPETGIEVAIQVAE